MDNEAINTRQRVEKRIRSAMDSKEKEYIRKRESILKELKYLKSVKRTGKSEENLQQMLVALERQYRFDRNRCLRQLGELENLRSAEEKLQDILLPFRWFAKMVLRGCRVLSRHSVITGVFFIALALGLCIWTIPWIKAVFHHQETMCTGSYWAMLSSIPIFFFVFIPWMNNRFDKMEAGVNILSILTFLGFVLPLIAYVVLFLAWVVAIIFIMLYIGYGYFLLILGVGCCSVFGAAYMRRKFDVYDYGLYD